ncbi:hypothetical protein F5Y14DRAFT_407999 [Nemania sp. NC0429]|nr:hypothetical protein F5Y14DRAFT_407999 [Nemania sp. NC0429]
MVGTTLKMLAMAMISGVSALPLNADGTIALGRTLRTRQSGQYLTNTVLVGDGNPHQVPWDQQVSASQECGDASTCAVSVTTEHTIEYSFSIEGAYEWISGGFSVGESYTDGESHECGGSTGETVCVWRRYQYTAYTVADETCYYFNGAASDCTTSDSYVTSSPNNCQTGEFFCETGDTCSSEGAGYWEENTGAGGPPC